MSRLLFKGRTRRQFIAACGLAIPTLSLLTCRAEERKKATVSEAFDREIESFMQLRKVPGGALAVVKDRRLVYARGYGWADRDRQLPARPDSLFRIASISKPFTAVGELALGQKTGPDFGGPAIGFKTPSSFFSRREKIGPPPR